MHHVHLSAGAKITAHRAGRRFKTARGPEHLADNANHLQPFHDRRHYRAACNERLQGWVPIFLHMLGIVLLGQVRCHAHHLHRDDVETLVLKPCQNAAHEAALDTVGFEEDESAFHQDGRGLKVEGQERGSRILSRSQIRLNPNALTRIDNRRLSVGRHRRPLEIYVDGRLYFH